MIARTTRRQTFGLAVAGGVAFLAAVAAIAESASKAAPPGDDKTATTKSLEFGSKVLQSASPLAPMDIYLSGFHPLKNHPGEQMEAHHFCRQVNEDFAQCVLFDGSERHANLTGIEYIISEKLFDTLPAKEKKYWHPHNGEILSGQLRAPGIPQAAEKELMRRKMNSYGKTWHLWHTGVHGRQADALPLGEAMLAWSFNRDGEADPAMLEARDRRLQTPSAEFRRQRADLQAAAKPQAGVDALKGKFNRETTAIPGVVDQKSAGR